jgi:hypothetical protein
MLEKVPKTYRVDQEVNAVRKRRNEGRGWFISNLSMALAHFPRWHVGRHMLFTFTSYETGEGPMALRCGPHEFEGRR